MTIYDLLFIVLLLAAIGTLIRVAILAVRGRRGPAMLLLRSLLFCAVAYLGMVYAVTALSKRTVLHIGDPECNDDWCIAVESVKGTPKRPATTIYDVTIRIFSRARGRPQRENIASDVYLVDSNWSEYDPIPNSSNIPLNALLQPGESVMTGRTFELPSNARDVALRVRHYGLPVCLIIGECGAFHKGIIIRLD